MNIRRLLFKNGIGLSIITLTSSIGGAILLISGYSDMAQLILFIAATCLLCTLGSK